MNMFLTVYAAGEITDRTTKTRLRIIIDVF